MLKQLSELCQKYKMSKAVISRLVNKYKTKGTVETEHLGGRPKKSTHTYRKINRYVKKNPLASARYTITNWNLIFQKILYGDVWMMRGCTTIVPQKND